MVTAVAWAATLTILAGCATYACAVLRGHTGGPRCLRRALAYRATKALLITATWAARRARAERGRP